jgi:hypothetical protein
MVAAPASRGPLSPVHAISPEDDAAAERWRQWQLRNAATSRKGAERARRAFAVIFAAVGVWLGSQLLAPWLWP